MHKLWSPVLVSVTSIIAAFTTVVYALGVISLFLPVDASALQDFFYEYIILWVYIPFSSCVVYMYTRTNVGRQMLARGDYEGALAWSTERILPNIWIRTMREALVHRVVMGRALLALDREAEGRAVLTPPESLLPAGAPEVYELRLWRAEIAMYQDALDVAAQALGGELPESRRISQELRARWHAARSTLHLRRGELEQAREALDAARWVKDEAARHRVALSAAALAERAARDDEERRAALAALIEGHEALVAELPRRDVELWALRGGLHEQLGEDELAKQALARVI
jgi:tetratricopeptide (TPR) repeat protein